MYALKSYSSVEKFLRYLVVKALAGRINAIQALYDYIVSNESPSVVAYRHGLSKHQLRGYAQRIIEKAGSELKAKILLRIFIPYILNIKPLIILCDDGSFYCPYCNIRMDSRKVEDHVRSHRDLVTIVTRRILMKVRERKYSIAPSIVQ